MKMQHLFNIALGSAFVLASAMAQAEEVWSDEYEEYIDADFTQHVICSKPPAGKSSDRLVWSDQYEAYVAADLPVLVIASHAGEGSSEPVYRAEYESYVAGNLPQLSIPNMEGCSLS